MSSLSNIIKRDKTAKFENQAYKIGEPVKNGVKAIIPSKNGKEESCLLVYKRKAEYRFNV